MILDVLSAVLIGFGVYFFGETLLGLYTSDASVIALGLKRLFWVAMFLSLNAIMDIYLCSIRGMGISTIPTILMIIGIVGIRIGWLLIVFPHFRELDVIYMCYPISWAITSLIEGIYWYYIYNKKIKIHLQ